MRKKRWANAKEAAIRAFFFTCGVLAILVLIGIFLTLLTTAIPAFREIHIGKFLTGKVWDPTSPEEVKYGILSMIVSSLLVTFGALVIAVPIGIGVAACGLHRLLVQHPRQRAAEVGHTQINRDIENALVTSV